MFLPSTKSFSLIRTQNIESLFASEPPATDSVTTVVRDTVPIADIESHLFNAENVFLPSTHTFSLVRSKRVEAQGVRTEEITTIVAHGHLITPGSGDGAGGEGRSHKVFLPSTHSFSLVRRRRVRSEAQAAEGATADVAHEASPDPPPIDGEKVAVGDRDRRSFLKAAGVASAGLVASQLLPKQAHALVLGSSPTTGVVGVKDASNARINPATEETLSTLLKASDLTFDAGALEVKITGAGSTSFSDSGDVARSALVDGDRHVQVDVLSSTLPASASTETTLQTISFGGYKFSLRLATVGDIDYVGEAAIGTATSAASWRIKKVDTTSGIAITWAGTGIFDQVWDNRVSLSYS